MPGRLTGLCWGWPLAGIWTRSPACYWTGTITSWMWREPTGRPSCRWLRRAVTGMWRSFWKGRGSLRKNARTCLPPSGRKTYPRRKRSSKRRKGRSLPAPKITTVAARCTSPC
uniref:(northern house mosquito) hypothetical protein n=1 Tax=Culex pipiens TaxID=7175 RepID=A0A8D8FUC0_CULPI